MSRTTTPLALALVLGALLTTDAAAQAAERFQPSGRGTSTVTVMEDGDPTPRQISIDYGQPHLRGRAIHTDSLVPYDTMWRTGANETTILETGLALQIEGVTVPAGRYAVFTLPARDGWHLILQADVGQGIGDYDVANDVARIPMRVRALHMPLESLTMWLIPATTGMQGELRMAWGLTEVAVSWTAAAES